MKSCYAFILISTLIAGCAANSGFKPPDPALIENLYKAPEITEQYRFQIGDIFDVKFLGFPEYEQSIIVRPDGRISLPLVDELHVAGMTPEELDLIITNSYKKTIKDPEVSIVFTKFAGQRIFIGGEVNSPGEKILQGKMTLTQSIFQAGGFTRTAELKNVGLIRKVDSNTMEVYLVDVDRIIYEGDRDVILKASDIIFVPKTTIAKVGDFVALYINAIIPNAARINFVYRLNNESAPLD